MRKNTNNMNNNSKNVLPARILSAAMAAFALLTAAPAVSMMPVHAAETSEFDADSNYLDDWSDVGGNDDSTNTFDDYNDLSCQQDDSDEYDILVVVDETYPSIERRNYGEGDVIKNDSNQTIHLLFRGAGGQMQIDLAPGESRTVVKKLADGVATKDYWFCEDIDTDFMLYTFTPTTPDIPQAQPQQTQTQPQKPEQPKHVCNMEWVVVKQPTKTSDGLAEYRCKSCGRVEMQVPINAATTYIEELYTAIDKAPANGTVTYDAGNYYTISKYVLQKMAMRNDVTVAIQFKYKNVPYVIVFPAKTDYTKLLQGKDTFYGFLGLNGYNGKVAVAQR